MPNVSIHFPDSRKIKCFWASRAFISRSKSLAACAHVTWRPAVQPHHSHKLEKRTESDAEQTWKYTNLLCILCINEARVYLDRTSFARSCADGTHTRTDEFFYLDESNSRVLLLLWNWLYFNFTLAYNCVPKWRVSSPLQIRLLSALDVNCKLLWWKITVVSLATHVSIE